MAIDFLRAYALSLPGATEEIKWEHNLCFCVGGKIFLVTNPDSFPVSASFKTSPENFTELTNRQGISQAPYFARNQWVQVADINMIQEEEWKQLIQASYRLVLEKLPKKIRESLV
ncbi:MAG: MmcQ/YjbR family DNA-binding protein [Chitinophagaceae bacterium]|jgi:predicted DNA-binding protein (MmcQ/YjbR family)|nr:MmcQ/YjbR family DNA-binding protein [Chitinophagaceae bacterium]